MGSESPGTRDAVAAHWAGRVISYERVLDALRGDGVDLDAVTPADLKRFDMLHVGGVEATDELARAAGISEGMVVLDAGCGLGGTARRLAQEFGAVVDALELTPQLHGTGTALTELVGLGDRVSHTNGTVVEMPYASGRFDVVVLQHCAMQVREKGRLFGECSRVLKPGGVLALHEIFAAAGGPIHYPVPWAGDDETSFLETWDAAQERLEMRGFEVGPFESHTDRARARFRRRSEELAARKAAGDTEFDPASEHALAVSEAMIRNLTEGRLAVGLAIARKAPRR